MGKHAEGQEPTGKVGNGPQNMAGIKPTALWLFTCPLSMNSEHGLCSKSTENPTI